MLRLWFTLAILLWTMPAWAATTYYVATTGSDANNGTAVGTPYRSIQKCASVMVAGDTCTVADGTYTDLDGGGLQSTGIVAYIKSSYTNGTAANPITIKATNRLGAVITIPGNATGSNVGFYIVRSYWIIDGFDITGGTGTGASIAHHGAVLATSTGVQITRNKFHDIARTLCYNTALGNTGIFTEVGATITSPVIDHNVFASIGRLRNGENGCSTSIFQHDHGMYVDSSTGMTITNNLFYDTNRGWPIQFYSHPSSNLTIANNTFADHCTSSPCPSAGHIIFGNNVTTATIKNNISYSPTTAFIYPFSGTYSGMTVSNNLSDSADADMLTSAPAGITSSGNLVSATPGFVNAGTRDYTLATGSAAIAAGTAVTGVLCNGTCDIGSFETFSYASAGISTPVATTYLDVQLGMSTNTPVLPATGQTGWTVACSGGSNCGTPVVASAAKLSGTDSVVRLTLSGLTACEAGQTWTVTYTSGTTTDAALVGGSLNQKLLNFATQAVANNCTAPAATGILAHKTHQVTQAQTPGTALGAVGAANTDVRRGTAFALVIQTDCTTAGAANCDAISQRLFYQKNGAGGYVAVPDDPGSDVGFFGPTSDPSYLSGTITCCLSGALTANSGSTQFTSAAVPNFQLNVSNSIVQRYQLRLSSSAALNDYYEFKAYKQTSTALDAYTPAGGAKITVTPAATIAAPTSVHEAGAASNTLFTIIWAPSTDVAFSGYKVYACAVSPCTAATGTLLKIITPASAAATYTTTTQFSSAVSVASTIYLIVTAFDSGGQESVASNEVTITRTGFTAPAVRVP